jgi:hypothetical protein
LPAVEITGSISRDARIQRLQGGLVIFRDGRHVELGFLGRQVPQRGAVQHA